MNTSRLIVVCLITLCIARQAHCDLVVKEYVPGQKVTLDTATGYYWYWNLADFTNMTYDEQIAAIGNLGTYGGIAGGWHMATVSDTVLWETGTLARNPLPSLVQSFNPTDIRPRDSDPTVLRYFFGGRENAINYPEYHHYNPYFHWSDYPDYPHYYADWDPISSLSDASRSSFFGAWVVTDQAVLPVPGAVVLAMIGLGVAGFKVRKHG